MERIHMDHQTEMETLEYETRPNLNEALKTVEQKLKESVDEFILPNQRNLKMS